MSKVLSSKGFSVIAAAIAVSLVATPMVIGAGNALATTDRTEAPILRTSLASAEAKPADPESCGRKVRVVYSGYGAASGCNEAR